MNLLVQFVCVAGLALAVALLVCVWALGRLPGRRAERPEPPNPNAHAYRRRGW